MLVAVHHHDNRALGHVEAGCYGGRLAEVPAELKHFYPMVAVVPGKGPLTGSVATTVVDQYQLGDNGYRIEDEQQFLHHGINVFFLVIKRHNNS